MQLQHPLRRVAQEKGPLRFEEAKELLIPIHTQGIARIRGEHLMAHGIRDTHREKPQQIRQNVDAMSYDPKRGIEYRPWLLHTCMVNKRSRFVKGAHLCLQGRRDPRRCGRWEAAGATCTSIVRLSQT